MLDIEFLRSLGIREDRLFKAGAESGDQVCIDDLPLAGEFMVPPEIMELSEKELRSLIMNNHSQEQPYTYRTPQGHTIAVYPDSGPRGRHDLEFTADEFLCMLYLIKSLDAKPKAYKPHHGAWINW